MEFNLSSPATHQVRYISTHTILPATHTESTQRLELTPWDLHLLSLHAIQKGLFFHKPNGNTWLTHLKSSLSYTLDHFFPLAGRLATETHDDGDTISVFIQCNNAGAQFIHATADLTLSDVLDPLYIPRVIHNFFSPNDMINYDGQSQPLVFVQVTELIDGIFIGCTMNHIIADGSTFWHFMNSWSEICKSGSHQISSPPNLNRWFLNENDLSIRIPASTIEKSIRSYTLPHLDERMFHFTSENIAKLKAKATANTVIISSLQAVLAHVWIGVTRARNIDFDQQVSYGLLMGNRARLSPPLPATYFGNSVNSGIAIAKVGELMNGGLGFAARLLNEVVSLHVNAKICSAWEDWVKEPKLAAFDVVESKNILYTGSSPRFDMYGNDFGWGCPIAVRSGRGNKFDGKMTIYPGAIRGSMDIEACLSPETLRCLGEDSEFMEFVGIAEQ
ncbi:hypothetical protein FRX31_002175 [Thalictrum thalictroides]|uniref:HXXXD-type acyl-transferase family protein n=1 Tax=Thalictrum thalictroides TaxID=46969 RepID=A0A7J6XGD7_THATH|nr:hypothetical protein FRX31_002175 [Thalictrum thalictroides]